jgi:hypothetical protein
MAMKTKKSWATIIVATFASVMVLVSCGKSEQARSDKNVPDSAINDSVPPSGENEYQNDLQPQGTPNQLDTLKDTVDRKP